MNNDEYRSAAAETSRALGDFVQAVMPTDRVGGQPRHLETVLQIPVSVKIVLGSATMPVASVLKLGRGAVVPLDERSASPWMCVVNGRVVARGEVVVLDEDNSRFGVSLTEVIGVGAPTRVA